VPTPTPDAGDLTVVLPHVTTGLGATPLPGELADLIEVVVVDTHRHRPDMFEITFLDRDLTVAATHALAIGTVVAISSASVTDDRQTELIRGEITAVEGVYTQVYRTVVRGYTRDHRLQRVRRNRTFLNTKDSDIAGRIAREHGLAVGTVDQTRTAHDHVGQVNQTDWEFLRTRAEAIGFDLGMVDDRFCFTRAADVRTASAPVTVRLRENLRVFCPRVTAGNLAAETEVRVWDPAARRARSTVAPTTTSTVDLKTADPVALARTFRQSSAAAPTRPDPTLGELGPAPTVSGHVLATTPVANGTGIDPAAREAAAGAAARLAGTVAEAEGELVGDPRVRGGTTVDVRGTGAFDGRWLLTRAVHTYDRAGYRTRFEVSGEQERSILGLTTRGARPGLPANIPGVVCGVVSNIADPEGRGRVQVVLPWLSPVFVSDWAPVAHAGAGPGTAAVFPPEVGDQVLVAFEFGDPRRPYVLGGLPTGSSAHTGLGGDPVKKNGQAASVVWRGLLSPTGNRLAFHDERTPGTAPATTAAEIYLGTARGDVALVIDQVKGTVAVRCGDGGTIDVRAGKGGTVNVGGGARLNLTADAGVKIESKGPVEIKGNPIKLN
jgi:phage protein D